MERGESRKKVRPMDTVQTEQNTDAWRILLFGRIRCGNASPAKPIGSPDWLPTARAPHSPGSASRPKSQCRSQAALETGAPSASLPLEVSRGNACADGASKYHVMELVRGRRELARVAPELHANVCGEGGFLRGCAGFLGGSARNGT